MLERLITKPIQRLINAQFRGRIEDRRKEYVDKFFDAVKPYDGKTNVLFIDEHFLYDPDNRQRSVISTLFSIAENHGYNVVAVQRTPSMKEPYTNSRPYLEMSVIDLNIHHEEIVNDKRAGGVLYIHDCEVIHIHGADSSGMLLGITDICDTPIDIGQRLEVLKKARKR